MLTLGFSVKQKKVSPVIIGPMMDEEGSQGVASPCPMWRNRRTRLELGSKGKYPGTTDWMSVSLNSLLKSQSYSGR